MKEALPLKNFAGKLLLTTTLMCTVDLDLCLENIFNILWMPKGHLIAEKQLWGVQSLLLYTAI